MTENQRQQEEMELKKLHRQLTAAKYLLITIVFLALLAGLCSCSTQGYGCKGRSKLITRVPQ